MAAVSIDEFADKLTGILDKYGEEVTENMQDILRETAAAGKAQLKKSSPRSRVSLSRKHYADNWAVREEISRLSASETLYNKSPTYRVAHLLEHGHAKRGGGRVAAIPHIKPVEQQLISTVENRLRRAIE